ncbi:MAG: DUF4340 domain-containing protein [Anaerolineae bacterium]|nr:DUF4340 domain-containing protein [Anaerolineae bacterium]
MKLRNTLIVVAIAAALIVYVFLIEAPLTPEQLSARQGTPTATPSSYIFRFPVEQLQTIIISDLRFPRRVVLERSDSGWRVKEPEDKPADMNKATGTANTLSDLLLRRTIQPVSDLAAYGLAPARIEARMILKDGTTYALLIGNATPDGSLYYATYTGDTTRVFLVESALGFSLQNLLDKPPFEPTPRPTPTETPPATPTPDATTVPGVVPTLLPTPATTPKP